MTLKQRNEKIDKLDLAFVISTIIIGVLLVIKARYGFAKKDEAFYLAIPYRILQGDKYLIDETHLCQLFSFLLLPILKLFLLINGNLDSVILTFRYFYVFFQVLTSVFIYCRLKRFNKIGSLLASITFLIYCPYNLMSLSYNTIAIMVLMICFVLLITYRNKIELYLAGLLYAAAVLCNPYLLITYVIYFVIVIINAFKKQNKIFDEFGFFSIKEFLFFTLGAATLAAMFFVKLFSQISINELFDFLKEFEVVDDEHPYRSLQVIISTYFTDILNFTKLSKYFYICFVIAFVLPLLNKKHINTYLLIIVVLCGCYLLDIIIETQLLINYIFIPISIVGLYTLVFCNRNSRLLFIYILGFLYTFYSHMASDMEMKTISSCFIICHTISIVSICDIFSEHNNKELINRLLRTSIILLFVGFISIETIERTFWVFSFRPISGEKVLLTEGPYNGLIVGQDNYDEYTMDMEIVEYIRENCNGKSIVFLTDDNWMYLIAEDYRAATPSSWSTLYTSGIHALNEYYLNNPMKIPNIIYVDDGFENAVYDIDIIDNYQKQSIIYNRLIFTKK